MKRHIWILLILSFLGSCTQRYVDYDVIHKLSFKSDKRPVAPVMGKGRAETTKQCFNQWLFFSNAEVEKERFLPNLVQVTCPGSEWLIDTRVTHLWWTTIFFSQACVEVAAHCPLRGPQ